MYDSHFYDFLFCVVRFFLWVRRAKALSHGRARCCPWAVNCNTSNRIRGRTKAHRAREENYERKSTKLKREIYIFIYREREGDPEVARPYYHNLYFCGLLFGQDLGGF